MNERVSNILKNPWTIPTAVGVVAFGAGTGLGYILGRRRQTIVVGEGAFNFDTAEWYDSQRIIDEEGYRSPATAPETDALVTDTTVIVRPDGHIPDKSFEEELRDGTPHADEQEETFEPVTVNVFDHPEDEDWDWDEEVRERDPEGIYILHRDEFHRNEEDFTQSTLTYYIGDDIAADEDNTPVHDVLNVTGPLKFGHGSGDPNVVFVRNHERRAEYEVCRHEGSYMIEVLGLELEKDAIEQDLKHAKIGKFRPE